MAEASSFYETYFVKSVSYIAFQVGEIFWKLRTLADQGEFPINDLV